MRNRKDRLVIEAHFSESDAKIWIKSDGKCVYCGEDLIMTSLGYYCSKYDHLLPVSKYKNVSGDENNLVLSCKLCNHLKNNFDPLEPYEEDQCKNIIADEKKRAVIIARVQRYIAGKIGKRHAEWWAVRQILRGPEME